MWPYPRVLAHRGAGKLAPENTLAAMRAGWEHGFRAVEFDVMLTRDQVPVLMHDPEFGRTVSGQGKLADTNAADLLTMDAGAWFGAEFVGVTVPSYREVISYCRAQGIWMNVEIKPAPGYELSTAEVAATLTREMFADVLALAPEHRKPADLPLFSSFSFDAVETARKYAPEIPRAYLLDEIPKDWLEQLRSLDAVALHTNHKHLTPDMAKAIKGAGYGLFCYTVNTRERAAEILSWGVDAFCTDRIDLIGPEFATEHSV